MRVNHEMAARRRAFGGPVCLGMSKYRNNPLSVAHMSFEACETSRAELKFLHVSPCFWCSKRCVKGRDRRVAAEHVSTRRRLFAEIPSCFLALLIEETSGFC